MRNRENNKTGQDIRIVKRARAKISRRDLSRNLAKLVRKVKIISAIWLLFYFIIQFLESVHTVLMQYFYNKLIIR